MSDLLDRLRTAHGPDREIDAEIAKAVGIPHRSRRTASGKNKGREWMVDTESGGIECWSHHPPAYTASIDQAMTLVLEPWSWTMGRNLHHGYWHACCNRLTDNGAKMDNVYSDPSGHPAIALCIAALLSRGIG